MKTCYCNSKYGCDSQDSDVLETSEVRLGYDCQVVPVQISAKQTGKHQVREQEVKLGYEVCPLCFYGYQLTTKVAAVLLFCREKKHKTFLFHS